MKPAKLKYSLRVVLLDLVKEIIQITCCQFDRSHRTELNQQENTKFQLFGLFVPFPVDHVWVWFGISISCVAIHNRFQTVVFASILCKIGHTYSAAQEKDLRLTMLCCSRLCPQCNFMDHATQEKELLLKRIGHITQIISVQPNLPQEKARKSRQFFYI